MPVLVFGGRFQKQCGVLRDENQESVVPNGKKPSLECSTPAIFRGVAGGGV